MNINYYKKYEPIDGKWYIKKELGSGAFGTVFEVERRDFSNIKAAMKIVSIPGMQSEVENYRRENYDLDEKSITAYFYGFVEEFIKEFQLMSKLKGHSNIVSYEDHDVKRKTEGFGWDIFIRMELLTAMNDHFRQHPPKQSDVIKIGIDICKALEHCQKYKIIHRDIKPSNIFISESGDYKLGDFGVARTLEKTSSDFSKKGTYIYMAPEVYKGEAYGSTVDIYSLGLVMYKLLNNNMEPLRKDRSYGDGEKALIERMKGTVLPKPANADGRLAEIVLKACSYNPKDRYENPLQMREELENILYTEDVEKVIYPYGDEVYFEPSITVGINTENITKYEEETIGIFDQEKVVEEPSAQPTSFTEDDTVGIISESVYQNNTSQKTPKTLKIPILIVSAIILVIGLCSFLFRQPSDLISNNHTVSSWSGFAHAYSRDSNGRIYGGEGVDSNDVNTYGDVFIISDYANENEVTEIVASSKQLSERGYYLKYPTIIVEDNIPEVFELDTEYTFKFKLKTPVVPGYIGYLIGNGGGTLREGELEYNNGYYEIPYTFNYTFDSTQYSFADEIRIRIYIEYNGVDDNGDKTSENHYIDCYLASNNQVDLDSNNHTVSSWGGFAHAYSTDPNGRIYGGEGVDSNDVNTYGDVFIISDYANENEVTEIVTSSKQLSERGYYLKYPTIIVEDNIPETFELDKEYTFKLKLKAPVVPNYVSYLIGKGGGILEEGELEYNNGYFEIPYTFNWKFDSNNYSFGDEVKIQIIIHYEDVDDNGDHTFEEHFIECL